MGYLAVDGFAAFEIALVCVGALYLLSATDVATMLRRLRRTSGSTILFVYLWGLISAAWSEQPVYSAFQAIEVLTQILLLFLASFRCANFVAAEKSMLIVVALATAFGMAQILRFHGLTLNLSKWHTNQYTATGAMLLCYCIPEFLTSQGVRRKRLMIYGTFAAVAVAVGTSAASIIAALAGVALTVFLLRGNRWPLVLLSAAAILAWIVAPDAIYSLLFPGKTTQQVTTMTGRHALWTLLMNYFWQSPIIGHGFAMGTKLSSVRATGVLATNTHNSLLSVMLGMGLIGVAIVGVAGFRFVLEFGRSRSAGRPGAVGVGSSLFAGLLNAMAIAYLGEIWRSPSVAFAGVLALHVMWIQRHSVQGGQPPSGFRRQAVTNV